MSNLGLTFAAQSYAEQETKRFLKEYNSGELTELGKRELLRDLPMFAFMAGYASTQQGQVLCKAFKLVNLAMNSYSNEDSMDAGNSYMMQLQDLLKEHVPSTKLDLQLEEKYELPASLKPVTGS